MCAGVPTGLSDAVLFQGSWKLLPAPPRLLTDGDLLGSCWNLACAGNDQTRQSFHLAFLLNNTTWRTHAALDAGE